jgi:hypothetical protein
MSEINLRNKFLLKINKKVLDLTESIRLLQQFDRKLVKQYGGVGKAEIIASLNAKKGEIEQEMKTANDRISTISSNIFNLSGLLQQFRTDLGEINNAITSIQVTQAQQPAQQKIINLTPDTITKLYAATDRNAQSLAQLTVFEDNQQPRSATPEEIRIILDNAFGPQQQQPSVSRQGSLSSVPAQSASVPASSSGSSSSSVPSKPASGPSSSSVPSKPASGSSSSSVPSQSASLFSEAEFPSLQKNQPKKP